MELDDALMILTEIATGDQEREAMCLVKESIYGLQQEALDNSRLAETYRSLYEDAQKRITRLRDVAARPDIYENTAAAFAEKPDAPLTL